MGQRTSSFPERKGACDGIKVVRDPMQGIFSVSASNERIDSADSSVSNHVESLWGYK